MRSTRFATVAIAAAGLAAPASAQTLDALPASEMTMETTVVTATGWESRVAETAPAITVITAEEIERKKLTTISDALREVPGVVVLESGSRGSQTSILLRGADSDQVLVLVDGIEVNSATLGSFDWADLTTENVERIEVLRGWGGTLYGSEAIGGVIQVFTRRGSGPPRGSVRVAGGNAFTDREAAEVSGESGIFAYSGSASHIRTEGFKPENDEYENTVVSGRLDAAVTDTAEAGVVFRLGTADFSNFASNNFLGAPDPNAEQETDSAFTRGQWSHGILPGVRYRLGAGYARTRVDFRDPPDVAETSALDSVFVSEVLGVDAETQVLTFGDRVSAIAGIEIENRAGDVDSIFSDPTFGTSTSAFDEDIRTVAGYTLEQVFFDERRIVLTAGVRVDDNERFGRAVSPAGGASWTLAGAGTRFRATYAEGFKAPSLNELFFPGFGNPDLEAEKSWEVTAGVDQPVGPLTLSASVFRRELEDLIESAPAPDGSGAFLAQNIGEATIDGIEASVNLDVAQGLQAAGQYTFLDVDAEPNGRVRRPKHSGSIAVAASRDEVFGRGDRLVADVRLLLVGARDDFDPRAFFAIAENDAYQRADLAVSWSAPVTLGIVRRLEPFVRIENLFDRDYDETLGFGARPLNFLAGIKAELG